MPWEVTPPTNEYLLKDVQIDKKFTKQEKDAFKKLNESLEKPEEASKLKDSLWKQLEEKFKVWTKLEEIKTIINWLNEKQNGMKQVTEKLWWKSEEIWLVQLYLKLQWNNPWKIDWVMWKNTLKAIKEYSKTSTEVSTPTPPDATATETTPSVTPAKPQIDTPPPSTPNPTVQPWRRVSWN